MANLKLNYSSFFSIAIVLFFFFDSIEIKSQVLLNSESEQLKDTKLNEKIEFFPNNWTIEPGNNLMISGILMDAQNNPLPNKTLGLENPILMMSIPNATSTNQNGIFSYLVETNLLTKQGNYAFVFYYNSVHSIVNLSVLSSQNLSVLDNGQDYLQLNSYTIDMGAIGESLGDGETVFSIKTNSTFTPYASPYVRTEETKKFMKDIGENGLDYILDVASNLGTNPLFWAGLAGFVGCYVPTGVTQATCGPATIMLFSTVSSAIVVETSNKIVDVLPISEDDKNELYQAIDNYEFASSIINIDLSGNVIESGFELADVSYATYDYVKNQNGDYERIVLSGTDDLGSTQALVLWFEPCRQKPDWNFFPFQENTTVIKMSQFDQLNPSYKYYFDFTGSPTGGTGGSDSEWQESNLFSDLNLEANHQYGYRGALKFLTCEEYSWTTTEYSFTSIEFPQGIIFGSITPTSIETKSSNTPSGLTRGQSGLIIYDHNDPMAINSGWKQNNNYWNRTNLNPNSQYGFYAKARNGDGDLTASSPTSYIYTHSITPFDLLVGTINSYSVELLLQNDGNPNYTKYAIQNTTTGKWLDQNGNPVTSPIWRTKSEWDIITAQGLLPSTSYSFAAKARNENNVETFFGPDANITTMPPPDGLPVLSNTSLTPVSGTSSESYIFSVVYSDPEGQAPSLKRLVLNGQNYNMDYIEGSYNTGALFEESLNLSVGNYSYYYKFSDGLSSVVTQTYLGPEVVDPDFTMTAVPQSQTISIYNSAQYIINTTSLAGYNGMITLSVDGLDPTLNYSFNDNTIIPGESATLTISPQVSASPGTISFQVKGASGTLQHYLTLELELILGTFISGTQSGEWTLSGSPYLVTGNISIEQGDIMTIQPGVEIKFQGNYKFQVFGCLKAIGDLNNSIIFTSENHETGWGGLRFYDYSDESILNNCIIEWCVSDESGGGISMQNTDMVISNCMILNNRTINDNQNGAGIYISGGKPMIYKSTITGNSSFRGEGNGIYCSYSSPKIFNCYITDNTTTYGNYGGGLAIISDIYNGYFQQPLIYNTLISGNQCDERGGGIYLNNTDSKFINCIITDNQVRESDPADGGGGLFVLSDVTSVFVNCIIKNNVEIGSGAGSQIRVDAGNEPLNISYCNIQNYGNSNYVNGPIAYGQGMQDSDPMLNGDFTLNVNSPCIDSGDPISVDGLVPPGMNQNLADIGIFGGCINYLNTINGLAILPQYLDFKQVKTNTTRSFNIEFFNYSSENLTIQNVTSINPDIEFIIPNTTIQPFEKSTITVNYSPSSLGIMEETIFITISGNIINYKILGEGVSETTVYGEVSGTWFTEDSPVKVTDNIYVSATKSLTIEPGVHVIFNGNFKFDVFGDLFIDGIVSDSVFFTSNLGIENWKGIRIYNSLNSFINYCHFENSHKTGDYAYPDEERYGGCLFVLGSTIEIANCYLTSNMSSDAGGALYLDKSYFQIFNSKFNGNDVLKDWDSQGSCKGGGAVSAYESNGKIVNCEFIDCSVISNSKYVYGGAITIVNNSLIFFEHTNFYQNSSISTNNYGRGGAIANLDSEVYMDSCIVGNNLANSQEPGGTAEGGGIYSNSNLHILNCKITNNSALSELGEYGDARGAGIYFTHGNLINSEISFNNANSPGSNSNCKGGGIYTLTTDTITGNLIYSNSCSSDGESSGGGISTSGSCLITNNTIFNNSVNGNGLNRGGGVYGGNFISINNIIWGNTGNFGSSISGVNSGTPPIVSYSLVQNYQSSGSYNSISYGSNILDTNPYFINSSNENFHLQSQQYGYPNNSPCIDYGHPDYIDACLTNSTGLGLSFADLGAYGGPYNCGNNTVRFLALETDTLNFGSVYLSQDSLLVTKLTNLGNEALTINSLVISGQDSLAFSILQSIPVTIPANSAHELEIKYSPLDVNPEAAILYINSNNMFGTKSINLFGNGIQANINLSQNTIEFGEVLINTSDTLTMTITNTGNGDLRLFNISINDSSFIFEDYEDIVQPGNDQAIYLIFIPTERANYNGVLTIQSNCDTLTISLSGIGIGPLISANPTSLDYGLVLAGNNSQKSIHIQNPGTADLHVTNIISTNPAFQVQETNFFVPELGTHELFITYNPLVHQDYLGYLEIQSDVDTLISISLMGQGYFIAYQDIGGSSGLNLPDNSRSSSWADYDLDGYEDIFIANYNSPSKLYRNNGNETFTDRTNLALISINGPVNSGVWGDYDNDGDPDLYVTLYNQPNVFYVNEGDGTFSDFSTVTGTNYSGPTNGASWSDYNNDGYLDIFVCNYGTANILYENQGDGTFINQAPFLGLDYPGQSQIGIWADFDLDNDQDLYVVNWNNEPNLFYINENNTFTESASLYNLTCAVKSKSANWVDYDNDGDYDLYVVNWLDQKNRLYRNDFPDQFTDVTDIANLGQLGYNYGACWTDYDNDGWHDLILVTWIEEKNKLLRNMGDGTFINYTDYAGMNDIVLSRSVSSCDFNSDGWEDIYVTVDGGNNKFYKNLLFSASNNWLEFKLNPQVSNESAIGARIDLIVGGNKKSIALNSGEGYFVGNSFIKHIGLGSMEIVDKLLVYWPSGAYQELLNVDANQKLILTEPNVKRFDLKIALEGPLSGLLMNTDLNESGDLPLTQPYNSEPWHYNGSEYMSHVPNDNVVDWVLLDFRDTPGDASTALTTTSVTRIACLLNNDGKIVYTDGVSLPQMDVTMNHNLYIVIYHRNHLAILSNQPLTENYGVYSYDFTTSSSKTYGGSNAVKEKYSNIWSMISGDGDANGQIDNKDKDDLWFDEQGSIGYLNSDFDLDGIVDQSDKNNYWNPNSGKSSQLPKPINLLPSAPTNPSPGNQTTIHPSNVMLIWACIDPENDQLTFDVYFGINNPPMLMTSYQNSFSYFPGNLAFNTTYFWRIVAHDGINNAVDGEVWSFTTLPNQPPVLPFNPSPANGAGNQAISITLTWSCVDPDNDPLTYDVYFGSNYPPDLVSSLQSNTFYIPQLLNYNSNYFWKVIAYDSYNNLVSGEIWSFTTVANQAPLLPFNPNPTDGSLNLPINSTLSWSCNDPENDPINYNVYFGTTNPPQYIVSSGQFGNTFNPGLLNYNTTYFWKIVANDDHSNVTIGSIWNFTTIANQAPTEPSTPTPANGAQNQSINLTLVWTCSDPENDPLTFDLYFGTTNPPEILIEGQSGLTYTPNTLEYFTTYYWKIVEHDNHYNTVNGQVWNFKTVQQPEQCNIPITDDRNGQTYYTKMIGSQCWMAENLNIGTRINGGLNQSLQTPEVIEKYCYEDNENNCIIYGGLYQWDEMMQYSLQGGTTGICPEGWHLPSDEEWTVLVNYLGGETVAGGKMKESGTAHWKSPNIGANNESEFTGLGGGYRLVSGGFAEKLDQGIFWTSTQDNTNAWARRLYYNNAMIYRESFSKVNYGFSVRCLKN